VAVLVAGFLACVVLPLFPNPNARARRAACANNLRQLGIALNIYASEFQQYPNGVEWSGLAMTGAVSRLQLCLANDPRTLICPERAVETQGTPVAGVPFGLFSYGYNAAGSALYYQDLELGMGVYRHIAPDRIKLPSDMIALGDTGLGELSEPELSPHEGAGPNNYPCPQQLPSTRHRRGANILFCDGHVVWDKQSKWIEKTPAARREWNNDHEPHPETW
jgi:prepilin-type processing-associated H-X9-DG protein